MAEAYDVLISGGGLAGSTLALALADTSLRVGMVEAGIPAEMRTALGLRAIALSYGSVQRFDRLGLWSAMRQKAEPIEEIVVSECGRFGKTRMVAAKCGVPAFGYVIRAQDMQAELDRALAATAVTRITPARVMGYVPAGDCVEVTIRAAVESTVQARLLVGADGGDSKVREAANISCRTRDYAQVAVCAEVETALALAACRAHERFTATGPLALLPLGKKSMGLIWALPPEIATALRDAMEGEFLARLHDAFGWSLGRLRLSSSRETFPLCLRMATRLVAERMVLVGNAAHQLHPVAGQGFNLGLRDISVLADLLRGRGGQGADPGCAGLLARYEAARLPDQLRLERFTDTLVRWFGIAPAALGPLRGLLLQGIGSSGRGVGWLAGMGLGL